MNNKQLTRILRNDINLLITLHYLLEKKRLELVAQEMNLGQPAISHHLARLRTIFGDRLLVRTPAGAVLTPLAEHLRPQVAEILEQLGKLFSPDFSREGGVHKTVYRLCMPDDICTENLPTFFINIFTDDAWRKAITFEISTGCGHSMDTLKEGEIDFLISTETTQVKGVYSVALPARTCHLAVRPGHPLATIHASQTSLSRFPLVELDGMSVSSFPGRFNSHLLVKTLLRTTSATAAVSALLHSDALCILPDYIINKYGLETVRLPGGALLQQYYLHWHQIMNNDALHARLRESLRLYVKNTFSCAKKESNQRVSEPEQAKL